MSTLPVDPATAALTQSAIDALAVGVCVWLLEQLGEPASLRLVVCNAAAARFLGVSREQVLGRPINEAFPGSLNTPLPGLFTKLAEQGGEQHLGDVPYKDEVVQAGLFSIHARSLPARSVLVEFTNVTAQRKLEAEHARLLQQAEQSLAEATEALRRQASDAQSEARASAELARELDRKLEIIAEQNRQIRALSAPVLQVWPGVLVLPLVGMFDQQRSGTIVECLLTEIVSRRSRHVIIDVTALDSVESYTAGELIKMVSAVRLLGAEAVITGVRPQIATLMIQLGLELGALRTARDLHEGLRLCIQAPPGRS